MACRLYRHPDKKLEEDIPDNVDERSPLICPAPA
jgi:hypothetical protein